MKYNEWCHRKPFANPNFLNATVRNSEGFYQLSQTSQAVLLQHEVLNCDGLEFFIISNLKLEKPIKFENGLEIVPCFYQDMHSQELNDPLVEASSRMKRMARYLYDGWLPILDWKTENISKQISIIDETFSLFALTYPIYFEWEPKYFYETNLAITIDQDKDVNPDFDLEKIISFSNNLNVLSEIDRVAVYKSINWINKAQGAYDPLIKFLFYMVAIENLVHYIEKDKKASPAFINLRTRSDKDSVSEEKNDCIKKLLMKGAFESDPQKFVTDAYFDCVGGLKKNIELQLKNAFPNDDKLWRLFFEKINKKSLYDIRSEIAHGKINTLNVNDIEEVRRRLRDVKNIALKYIYSVLERSGVGKYPASEIKPIISLKLMNANLTNISMYKGPTHMALFYQNRI